MVTILGTKEAEAKGGTFCLTCCLIQMAFGMANISYVRQFFKESEGQVLPGLGMFTRNTILKIQFHTWVF